MPPLPADIELISEQLPKPYFDLEASASSSDQQTQANLENLETVATDLRANDLNKIDIEQALQLSPEEVTKERDLYEKKLKALSVVMAEMGFLKKENDELREDIGRLGKELADVKHRIKLGVAYCLGFVHGLPGFGGPTLAGVEAKIKLNFYGSVSGDALVE